MVSIGVVDESISNDVRHVLYAGSCSKVMHIACRGPFLDNRRSTGS